MADKKQSIYDVLNTLREENLIKIYIPSLKRTVDFKTINASHQKVLLKNSLDKTILKHKFYESIDSMIKDTSKEVLDFKKLNIVDKAIICISLRAAFIKDEYTTKGNQKILLSEQLKKVESMNIDKFVDNEVKVSDEVTIKVTPCSIERETLFAKFVDSKLGETTNTGLIVSEVYIAEISKYVKSIKFNEEELIFDNISVQECVKIIENVSSITLNSLVEYIESLKQEEFKVTKFGDEMIEIDGSFFSSTV